MQPCFERPVAGAVAVELLSALVAIRERAAELLIFTGGQIQLVAILAATALENFFLCGRVAKGNRRIGVSHRSSVKEVSTLMQ